MTTDYLRRPRLEELSELLRDDSGGLGDATPRYLTDKRVDKNQACTVSFTHLHFLLGNQVVHQLLSVLKTQENVVRACGAWLESSKAYGYIESYSSRMSSKTSQRFHSF